MADLKRHTARRLLELFEAGKAEWLMNQLRYYRASHKIESEHQVWQEGYHPQSIPTDEIMLQKLGYLHNNPVKRGLVVHRSIGATHPRTSGCPERRHCSDVTCD